MSPARQWLKVDEAADYLRCSERHIRDLLSRRELTPRKVAGRWLINVSELDAYADAQPTEWASA